MLTLFVVSVDRHNAILCPHLATPMPMKWAVALVWAISGALVLPYSAYITYIDLSVSTSGKT